jgi:hypothetical protein
MRLFSAAALAVLLVSCVPPPYAPSAVGSDGQPLQARVAVTYEHAEVRGLARDGDTLFASVFRYVEGAIGTSSIVRIDGQKITPIVSNLEAPGEIAVDSTHVYWLDQPTYEAVDTGLVRSTPKDGGGAITELTLTHGRLGHLALGSDRVLWIRGSLNAIESMAKSGGSVTTFATEEHPLTALTVSELGIIWATDREIRTLRGGVPTTLLSAEGVSALATLGADVYWAGRDGVYRLGSDTRLAEAKFSPTDLAVDDGHLYWTERDAHVCRGMLVAPRAGGEARQLDSNCSRWPLPIRGGVAWARKFAVMTAAVDP